MTDNCGDSLSTALEALPFPGCLCNYGETEKKLPYQNVNCNKCHPTLKASFTMGSKADSTGLSFSISEIFTLSTSWKGLESSTMYL